MSRAVIVETAPDQTRLANSGYGRIRRVQQLHRQPTSPLVNPFAFTKFHKSWAPPSMSNGKDEIGQVRRLHRSSRRIFAIPKLCHAPVLCTTKRICLAANQSILPWLVGEKISNTDIGTPLDLVFSSQQTSLARQPLLITSSSGPARVWKSPAPLQ